VLVAHAYNPSCSRGKDQEDHVSKLDWASSSQALISKNPSQKRAGGVAEDVDPLVQAPALQKRNLKNLYTLPYKVTTLQLTSLNLPMNLSIVLIFGSLITMYFGEHSLG
jgi:hypothetical protein